MQSWWLFVSILASPAISQVADPPIPGTPQIIRNGNFINGSSGWTSSPEGQVADGSYCVRVPKGQGFNVSYLRTTYDFLETKNDIYTLNFTASSSVGYDIRVQTPDPPLDPNLDMKAALTTSPYPFSMTFSPANQAPNATLEFNLGGSPADALVCIGSVSMKRIDRSGWQQDLGPAIKVNQLGYLANGPKMATLVTNNMTTAQPWALHDRSGKVCFEGQTEYLGMDAASNQTVSKIDFTSFNSTGEGYTLVSAGDTSFEFKISTSVYNDLQQDALRFFYLQRSGIEIDGNLVGQKYARPPGHLQIPPNKGDLIVPCQVVHDSLIAYEEPWTCNYTLDVTQGWYDAGDQGKYVVNGGISAAQLLMAYERRSRYDSHGKPTPSEDGSLRIPERHNEIPDILDEARWELDFLLKMQVPESSPPQLFNGTMIDMSSLAHHKMHDNEWTPLPTEPSQDPKRRELHRPSTAATLNLAAVAAMGARIFADFDATYAERCLYAAQTAYTAARRHPNILAPGTDWDLGGGAYSDDDVSDEFYWAAAEMYLTTSSPDYLADLRENPYHTANASTAFSIPSGFSWGSVAALGRLDLAMHLNETSSEKDRLVQSVMDAADMLIEVQQNQSNGYDVFITEYQWGSNSNHLNNLQVVATAADISNNKTYRDAALRGLDYTLGRNALAQSYVCGYGTKVPQNLHSRLYAHQLDDSVPRAPPGSMAGGANENASDPPADDVLQGCAPQTCYVDDVNSYSTNEVAINWGSALAWVVNWAATQ
ncbi:secreted endoglucanase [Hortaea werneckii]|uniref:cellulase n=2 Tax=Hortaea werneckii TaxID=91943 RepID=A0A3M7I992_HORWE|nr:secreted endoglucanase [Hortaea werneckii]OTA22082.1 hypothetical protein BTJ68_14754 [Hortaea werneckii EXF-2000]KAI6825221.1 secreted endoglucanase [Hortaea werneckii]KAI6920533.1 secreted endoglucanase [Hortaea werneckii]KAI6931832.1 secreted endoglucanase [Hortaea werneckii]